MLIVCQSGFQNHHAQILQGFRLFNWFRVNTFCVPGIFWMKPKTINKREWFIKNLIRFTRELVFVELLMFCNCEENMLTKIRS